MLQVIGRVHHHYRPDLLALIDELEGGKQIIRIQSPRKMRRFTQQITRHSLRASRQQAVEKRLL